jgi:hypothetical protein
MTTFSIGRCAAWIACCGLFLLPALAFVQEPKLHSLQAYSPPNHYMRHAGFLGRIGRPKTDLDARDANFRVVPGLADENCVSFEATNVRDHYLKHAFWRIVLAKRLDEQKFREDATFCIVWGLHRTTRSGVDSMSFRSFNFPDRYIRHRDFELWLDPVENSPLYRDDATFFMVQPAAREMSFEGDTVLIPANE